MTIIQDDLMKCIIEDYKSGLSPDKLSKKYTKFSPHVIRENLKVAGVFKTSYFTSKEIEAIKHDCLDGLSLKELAKKYCRPDETIRRKLKSMGLYSSREQIPYTCDEIDILRQYYPLGDWENLLKLLPNRNKVSINSKAHSLGIKQDGWNWTKERVNEILKEKELFLLSDFTNIKEKHKLIDNEGYLYNTNLVGIIYRESKPSTFSSDNIYTVENIKHYIEINKINCQLLSEVYTNSVENLEWKCNCGKTFLCPWSRFREGKHKCNDCASIDIQDAKTYSINDIKTIIEKQGYTMVDDTFTKLSDKFSAITHDGYRVIMNRGNVLGGRQPEVFHVNNPHTINNIKHYLEVNNIKTQLLSTEYNGNNKMLLWRCVCGNTFKRSWDNLKQGSVSCRQCSNNEKYGSRKAEEFEKVKQYFETKGYKLLSQQYVDGKSKLEYICEKHKDKGIQTISWAHCKHRNAGCKYCATEKNAILQRTPETDIRNLTESKGFIYDHVEYSVTNHNKTLIYFICPKHQDKGVQFKALENMRKSSGLCNYCLGKVRSHEDFLKIMSKINPNIEILSEYKNTANDILCRCKIDGYEWNSTGNRLLNGSGCIECARKQQSENSTKTHDEFESEINCKYNGKIRLLSKYTGSHDSITCQCIKHNTIWDTTPTSLLTSSIGCPTCVNEATGDRCRKSNEQFVEELSQINPDIIPLEEYTGDKNKIRCVCKIHNYVWFASPNKILRRKTGCPKCASYHNENNIDDILDEWGFNYTAQKRFDECKDVYTLPFDRYLEDFNILIEYDGEGHYIPIRRGSMSQTQAEENLVLIQRHDEIKNDFCKKNKIPLIRIPYWESENIKSFLFDELVKYNAIELVN